MAIQDYKVFIASPSDLGDERKIVRQVCEKLNNDPLLESPNGVKIMLIPVGWEDLPPAAGRPQDRINKVLDESDIVVVMLYRKFGTPTGAVDSGTQEEFLRAYDQWKIRENPKIIFYFKEATITSNSQLPQFMKVMELKEKIQTDEMLQYGNFKESSEFEEILEKDLKNTLKTLIAEAREAQKKQDAGGTGAGDNGGEKAMPAAVIPEAYKRWINDKTRCMDVGCLIEDSKGIQVILAKIFQPLFSNDPDIEREEILSGKKGRNGSGKMEEKQEPVEIEKLAAKGPTLLVSGLAGSGKTTLARHMARQIINDDSPYFEKGLLPVLIYFKDLRQLNIDWNMSGVKGAQALLAEYCEDIYSGFLTVDVVEAFCREGRAVFFLDGLDEADKEIREKAVSFFGDYQHQYSGNAFVLLGRPHGVAGKVMQRFGRRSVSVNDFTPAQAMKFIDTWFDHVHAEGLITGREIAVKMKGEVGSRENIDALKSNPLMLTAMCILYNDLKVLPDQRADLYNRIVERLFSRFEGDKVKVTNFMMDLAHSLFLRGERGMDENEAVTILKRHFEAGSETHGEIFRRIEPATGLLHLDNRGYTFIHQTFQEFLTARHLIVQVEDSFWEPIKDHVKDERFEEVVSLYIGFSSMRNPRAANSIVRRILDKDSQEAVPYEYLLGAGSLLDIHEDNRDAGVETLAMDRMQFLIRSPHPPAVWFKAGIAMGRLGHDPGYDVFVPVEGGNYELEMEDSKKCRTVEIDSFEMGKFPVTNAWYGQFMKDRGYDNKTLWSDAGLKWCRETAVTEPGYFKDRRFNCPTQPVVGISWYEAEAFCNWLSENDPQHRYFLPDEDLWQAAAAGMEKRRFAWGDEIGPEKCNYDETGLKRPSPVNIFLAGKTPEGIYDLSGNVWEWTASFYDKDRDTYVLRGGSFDAAAEHCRCAYRDYDLPVDGYYGIGFRCARIKL